MKQYTLAYVLDGLTEADFQSWKHHPVTKLVFRRYLKDRARRASEHQVEILANAAKMPEPFECGIFNGHINTVHELADLEFAHIVAFYPPDEEEAEGQE